jgi:hypothetical protein
LAACTTSTKNTWQRCKRCAGNKESKIAERSDRSDREPVQTRLAPDIGRFSVVLWTIARNKGIYGTVAA